MLTSSDLVSGSDGGHDGQAEAVALAVAGAVGAESLEGPQEPVDLGGSAAALVHHRNVRQIHFG